MAIISDPSSLTGPELQRQAVTGQELVQTLQNSEVWEYPISEHADWLQNTSEPLREDALYLIERWSSIQEQGEGAGSLAHHYWNLLQEQSSVPHANINTPLHLNQSKKYLEESPSTQLGHFKDFIIQDIKGVIRNAEKFTEDLQIAYRQARSCVYEWEGIKARAQDEDHEESTEE